MSAVLPATFIGVLLCVATSSFRRRGQSVTVHAALQSLDRHRGTRYQQHCVTMNSLSIHFVASWRLNYTLEHIIHTSTLVTVFTVRVGEHNCIVIIIIIIIIDLDSDVYTMSTKINAILLITIEVADKFSSDLVNSLIVECVAIKHQW